MWTDPIVEETRKLRDEYAARFEYDLAGIVQDLQERERRSGRELVRCAPRKPNQSGPRAA